MAVTVGNYQVGSRTGKVITCTKPTSLAVGDMLVAYMWGFGDEGDTISMATPSGWTLANSYTGTVYRAAYVFYKIADAGDVAASDFDFTFTTNDSNPSASGVLMRVYGATNSPYVVGNDEDTAVASTTFNASVNVDPLASDAVYLLAYFSPNGDSDVSSYTINGTNPTWTEIFNSGDAGDIQASFAHANANDATIITDVTIVVGASQSHWCNLMAVAEIQDATGTFTHLSTSPTFNGDGGSAGVVGTHTSLSVSPTLNKPTASGRSKTWTTTIKS